MSGAMAKGVVNHTAIMLYAIKDSGVGKGGGGWRGLPA